MSIVCISESATDVISKLTEDGVKCLMVRHNPALPKALASHADLQIVKAPRGEYYVSVYQTEIIDYLRRNGAEVIPVKGPETAYPGDCMLNTFFIGNEAVGNRKCISKEIASRYNLIETNQGYAKCSTIMLENAAVTDDQSIFTEIALKLSRCMYFPQNEIILEGYDKGFLGGSCGVVGRNVYFSGDPQLLDGSSALNLFFKKNGYSVIVSSSSLPNDFGGLVVVE